MDDPISGGNSALLNSPVIETGLRGSGASTGDASETSSGAEYATVEDIKRIEGQINSLAALLTASLHSDFNSGNAERRSSDRALHSRDTGYNPIL